MQCGQRLCLVPATRSLVWLGIPSGYSAPHVLLNRVGALANDPMHAEAISTLTCSQMLKAMDYEPCLWLRVQRMNLKGAEAPTNAIEKSRYMLYRHDTMD